MLEPDSDALEDIIDNQPSHEALTANEISGNDKRDQVAALITAEQVQTH